MHVKNVCVCMCVCVCVRACVCACVCACNSVWGESAYCVAPSPEANAHWAGDMDLAVCVDYLKISNPGTGQVSAVGQGVFRGSRPVHTLTLPLSLSPLRRRL